MSGLFSLFSEDEKSDISENTRIKDDDINSRTLENTKTEGSLQLHKEELDISKNNVDVGEVVLSKDVVEEEKTVDVPVMHEEVVIKRTPLNSERSDDDISSEEAIHIPVSKEEVHVNKYTVATEEFTVSKRQVTETQHVEETLKHEEAHVNTNGSVDIISEDSDLR
jgi:uncharacterized protein (TIGR02271 family)